uniref:Carboxypeptidase n=1 Tax=Meloidogyne floridensis TaxID=298350 RepID=A0A915P6J0_9BILA
MNLIIQKLILFLFIFNSKINCFNKFSKQKNLNKINNLPGLESEINFNHYSGYLQVSNYHFLHYWFVESQNDPENDPITAKENYEAVKQFFEIYPSFRNNYLFISGESYAGVYVPSLCALIVDGQKEYPLKLTVNLLENLN